MEGEGMVAGKPQESLEKSKEYGRRGGLKRWANQRAIEALERKRRKAGTAELNIKVTRALRNGVERMSEVQWQELKSKVLLKALTEPSSHGSISIKAIELIEAERERMKFGGREDLERTLKNCDERMRELRELEAKVVGAGGDTEEHVTEKERLLGSNGA